MRVHRYCTLRTSRLHRQSAGLLAAALWLCGIGIGAAASAQDRPAAPLKVSNATGGLKPARQAPERVAFAALVRATAFLESPLGGDLFSRGTGWLIDSDRRLIVTNNHVVSNNGQPVSATSAWFPVLVDGEPIHDIQHYADNVPQIPATVIYTDSDRDLALLQLESLPDGTAALPLAKASPKAGDTLHSLGGLPAGSEGLFIYTQGTSRAIYVRTIAAGARIKVLETQMPLNQGNSGGAIVNNAGEVVGVFEGLNIESNVQLVNMCIDLSEVRAFLDTALPLVEPASAAEFNRRGDFRYETGRYDLALADYSAALALEPNNADALANRGWVYYQRGDLDTAAAEFADALKINGALMYGLWGRGMIARDRGDYDAAVDDFTQAIRGTTDATLLASLYSERGLTRYEAADYEQAVADFDRGLEHDAGRVRLLNNKALALTELGRYDEAIQTLDRTLAIEPQNHEAFNLGGNVAFAQEKYDVAALLYGKAIEFNAREPIYFQNRGSALRQLSRPLEAVSDLTTATQLAPDRDDLFNSLGLAHYDARQFDEAIAAFARAIQINPHLAVYHRNRGDSQQQRGDHEAAVADLTAAIALSPDDAELYTLRGNSHEALGNAEAAAADFERAAALTAE